MSNYVSLFTGLALKAGLVGVVLNEVRGFILAAPALYMMYRGGGNLMAMWLGFCSLAGCVLSTVAPILVARKFNIFVSQAD